MPSTTPAADTGLPKSNVIAFPMSASAADAEFEPDKRRFDVAYMALCVSWQFAHLDDARLDLAVDEMVRLNRHGAVRMVRENADGIRCLCEASNFLIKTDARMQSSLSRVLSKLEAL